MRKPPGSLWHCRSPPYPPGQGPEALLLPLWCRHNLRTFYVPEPRRSGLLITSLKLYAVSMLFSIPVTAHFIHSSTFHNTNACKSFKIWSVNSKPFPTAPSYSLQKTDAVLHFCLPLFLPAAKSDKLVHIRYFTGFGNFLKPFIYGAEILHSNISSSQTIEVIDYPGIAAAAIHS